MADSPTITEDVVRRGRQFVTYSDGTQKTRKVDQDSGEPLGEWTLVEDAPPPPPPRPPPGPLSDVELPPVQLHVVARHQAEGEPKHWCLYAIDASSDEYPDIQDGGGQDGSGQDGLDSRVGYVWQVTGDAEHMHHEHKDKVPNLFYEPDYAWHETVCANLSFSAQFAVDAMAHVSVAPHADSRREVTENCQGWTMRVLRQLDEDGVVAIDESALAFLESQMEPV